MIKARFWRQIKSKHVHIPALPTYQNLNYYQYICNPFVGLGPTFLPFLRRTEYPPSPSLSRVIHWTLKLAPRVGLVCGAFEAFCSDSSVHAYSQDNYGDVSYLPCQRTYVSLSVKIVVDEYYFHCSILSLLI